MNNKGRIKGNEATGQAGYFNLVFTTVSFNSFFLKISKKKEKHQTERRCTHTNAFISLNLICNEMILACKEDLKFDNP